MAYTTERRREIGTESGKVYRQKALDKYYSDPNHCKHCGKVIEVPDGKKPGDIRRKKFCNHSCSARFNNKGRDRWASKRSPQTSMESTGFCEECGTKINYTKINASGGRKNGYYKRKFCDGCLHRLSDGDLTKAELKQKTEKWGYYGFRGRINRHANKTYDREQKPRVCKTCGFDIHVDICHIKDVSEFPDTELIKVINHIDNLVALCPNHHLMFDRGLIKI